MGKSPTKWCEVKDMSDSLEYHFRNYHFEVTEASRGDGVRIKVIGKDNLIGPEDVDEVQELIMNMGKWEKMLISIINLNKDLRIFAGIEEINIEEFIIDKYDIKTNIDDSGLRTTTLYSWIFPKSLKTPISSNIIFNLLKNATKWKLLNESINDFALAREKNRIQDEKSL